MTATNVATTTTTVNTARFAAISLALVMTLAMLAGIDQLATAPSADALLARTPVSQPA